MFAKPQPVRLLRIEAGTAGGFARLTPYRLKHLQTRQYCLWRQYEQAAAFRSEDLTSGRRLWQREQTGRQFSSHDWNCGRSG